VSKPLLGHHVFIVQEYSVQRFSDQPACRFAKPARCCGKRLEVETFRGLGFTLRKAASPCEGEISSDVKNVSIESAGFLHLIPQPLLL
jgi:hypothetical protein